MQKTKYVESGKLVGSVSVAAVAGKYGAKVAVRTCSMVLGVALKGRGELLCAIIGGAAGGYVGGNVGGLAGELTGDLIYQPEGA